MAYRETGRTTQRHRALDVVFEADERGLLYPEDLLDLLTERRSLSTAQVPIGEFGVKIVEAFADESYNVDTLIEAASEDWSLDRMNVVDRTILRLGTLPGFLSWVLRAARSWQVGTFGSQALD